MAEGRGSSLARGSEARERMPAASTRLPRTRYQAAGHCPA